MGKPSRTAGRAIIILCLALIMPLTTYAHEDEEQLIDIIHAIEQGWEQADGTPFREHFLDFDGARFFETGGQNDSLTDLIEHHVEPEGDALESLDLIFSNIQTHINGDFAWVLADVEVKATVRKDQRKIHNRGYETFIFQRIGGSWKVLHTHSSSRPVTESKSEKNAHADHEH